MADEDESDDVDEDEVEDADEVEDEDEDEVEICRQQIIRRELWQ